MKKVANEKISVGNEIGLKNLMISKREKYSETKGHHNILIGNIASSSLVDCDSYRLILKLARP